jgi:hypothetical protein
MVMNKKGYAKTVEAIIAVVIIFIFLIGVVVKNQKAEPDVPKDIELLQNVILNEIENNESLRDYTLGSSTKDLEYLNNFINNSIGITNTNTDFNISIVNLTQEIPINIGLPNKKTVYARSLIISSNFTTDDSRLLMLYLWYK